MNERSFVEPPWIETDGQSSTVIVKAYHWCGHPRFGFTTHRLRFPSLAEGVTYLARLGFAMPAMSSSSSVPVDRAA